MSLEVVYGEPRNRAVDGGERPGLTTDERMRLRELEKENRELKRATEILKDASIFFATELDGRHEGPWT